VYHEDSGDTHRLNAIGAAALKHLIASPLSAADLTNRLASEFGLSADDAFSRTIGELVARLAEAGVIARADDPSHPV
jgi:PqqD family protein of HPr-rel-A system